MPKDISFLLFLICMSITYTQHTLDKLESLLKSMDFKVRYEKGNFKTGACVLESSKVIVVNKFSNVESKINSLVQLIQQIPADKTLLNEKENQLLDSLKQTKLEF